MTRNTLAFLAIAAVAALGCGKDKDKPAGGGEAEPAGKPAEAAAPKTFQGPLTAELILKADGAVKPFEPWATALPKLEAMLGKPTVIDGSIHAWSVLNGESCTLFVVSKDHESNYFKDKPDPVDMVGAVTKPMTWNKAEAPEGNWAQCEKYAAGPAALAAEPANPAAEAEPAAEGEEADEGEGGW